MPFGMGRAGWLMWPYFAEWLGCWYPYGSSYGASYTGVPGSYGISYPYSPMSKEDEIEYLQGEAKMLKQEYDRIKARLKDLQKMK